jgi:hypothetical protein
MSPPSPSNNNIPSLGAMLGKTAISMLSNIGKR